MIFPTNVLGSGYVVIQKIYYYYTSTHFEPIRDDGAVFNPYDV